MKRISIKRATGLLVALVLAIAMSGNVAFAQDDAAAILAAEEAIVAAQGSVGTTEYDAEQGDSIPLTIEVEDIPELPSPKRESRSETDAESFTLNVSFDELTANSAEVLSELQEGDSTESDNSTPETRGLTRGSNNTPDTAIVLPESYYGGVWNLAADAQDSWLAIQTTETRKIQFILSHISGADYDVVLYKLDGTTLNAINASSSSTPSERISHVDTAGIYFIRIMPYIPTPTPSNFTFVINAVKYFDVNEPDDFYYLSNAGHPTDINVSANLDNAYDEDWHCFFSGAAKTVEITLSHNFGMYAALYDQNLNLLGSFNADGGTRSFEFGSMQNYYIRVLSPDRTSDPYYYNLLVDWTLTPGGALVSAGGPSNPNDPYYSGVQIGDPSYGLSSGHTVMISNNKLYINNIEAQINGRFMEYAYPAFNVNQGIQSNGQISFVDAKPRPYRHTYFVDGYGDRTSTVIPINIFNGYYSVAAAPTCPTHA